MPRYYNIILAAVFFVSAAVMKIACRVEQPRSNIEAHQQLVSEIGAIRSSPGRFSDWEYAVYNRKRAAVSDVAAAKYRKILRRKFAEYSKSDIAALMVADGKVEEAVDILEEEVGRKSSAKLLSDLSAALLAKADINRDYAASLSAVLMASRAIAQSPKLPEARFNLAVSLQKLGMTFEAQAEWLKYLRLDCTSRWADDARSQLVSPDQRSIRLQDMRHMSLQSAALSDNHKNLQELVSASIQKSVDYVEGDLIGEWAYAVHSQDTRQASQFLKAALAISNVINQQSSDSLLVSSLEAISRSDQLNIEQFRMLLEGHLLHYQGVLLERDQRFLDAQRLFMEARERLRIAHTPFVKFTLIHLATCEYYNQRYASALLFANEARKGLRPNKYHALTGRSLWLSGLAQFVLGKFAASLASYNEALLHYKYIHDKHCSYFLASLIASDLRRLGESKSAWQYRLDAISHLDDLDDLSRIYSVLWEAADSAASEGRLELSREFIQELVDRLRGKVSPSLLAEAYARRASILQRLNEFGAAQESINLSRTISEQVPKGKFSDRVIADVDMAQAQLLLSSYPAKAVDLYRKALLFFNSARYAVESASAQEGLAEASRRLGDFQQAEVYLSAGIREYETQRARLPGAIQRMDYFAQASKLFDNMMYLQIYDLGNPAVAFEFSERSHARELSREIPQRSVRDIQARLSMSTAIVEYAILGDRIFVWIITADDFKIFKLDVSREEVVKGLDGLRRGKNYASSQLYDQLLRPVKGYLRGIDTLVFVPDKFLYEVLFSALHDRNTGHFLVEDYRIMITPSASFFVECPRHVKTNKFTNALVVAGDAFDQSEFPYLPRLGGIDEEVAAIAALYPKRSLLQGSSATIENVERSIYNRNIIHFSGHTLTGIGVVDPSLLLAPDPKKMNFGLLSASGVERLRLRAEVVVLGGCGTAAGQMIRGEGTLSLARSFLVAGAHAVVASIWEINNHSSSQLLKNFHKSLSLGLSPMQALRGAQLELLREDHERPCNQWATFELIGGGYKI